MPPTILTLPRRLKQSNTGLAESLGEALQARHAPTLAANAQSDIVKAFLLSLGGAAAARGAYGLANTVRRDLQGEKRPPGPPEFPLPYPVAPSQLPARVKAAVGPGMLSNAAAKSKSELNWWLPGMLAATIGGTALGWKGTGALIDSRRQSEREKELEEKRREFHDALLQQYNQPFKTAAQRTAARIDQVFDALNSTQKQADFGELSRQAVAGYGAYSLLASLLAGSLVYDKTRRGSRQAVIDKAIQRRQRKQFEQQPSEMYAIPEPMPTAPQPSFRQSMQLLAPDKAAEDSGLKPKMPNLAGGVAGAMGGLNTRPLLGKPPAKPQPAGGMKLPGLGPLYDVKPPVKQGGQDEEKKQPWYKSPAVMGGAGALGGLAISQYLRSRRGESPAPPLGEVKDPPTTNLALGKLKPRGKSLLQPIELGEAKD